MKVLAINGSARKNGNTKILLETVFKELNNEGIETEIISLSGISLNPCKACFTCGGKSECSFGNDDFNKILSKMKEADGILLASPVYAANISSTMQALIERTSVVTDMNENFFAKKVGASIVVARRGGALNTADTLTHFFLNHEMFIVGSTYWNIGYGKLPNDVLEDKEALDNMKNIGKNMTYLLKKLNS